MAALLLAAGLIAGYGLGRWRAWHRLGDWVAWQLRFHTDRWASRSRQAALFALLLLTDPVRTVHAWRRRNTPETRPCQPLSRVPAPNRHPATPTHPFDPHTGTQDPHGKVTP